MSVPASGRRFVATLLLGTLGACSGELPPQAPEPPRTSLTHPELAADDLGVYAALLALRPERSAHVVREFFTDCRRLPDAESSPADGWAQWRDVTTPAIVPRPVPAPLLHGFSALAAEPGSLPEQLVLPAGWHFVARDDYERRCAAAAQLDPPQRTAWIEAVGPAGTFELSRIVYSADGTWALVWLGWFGGPMAGSYGVWALRRTDQGWRVSAALPLGFS